MVTWVLVEEPDEQTVQALLHVEGTVDPSPHDIRWITPMDGPMEAA